ncbi:MAG: hypothetical protein HYT98_00940 [Candidatus Sungbacteria bacterium]|nr:hypothetical protein [Candidatus Sungbacteria bacterium]
MAQDYFLALIYYLVFLAFAPAGFWAAQIFISDFRSAYAVSKLLGLLIFGYFIWLLSSLQFLDFQNIFFIRMFFMLLASASIWTLFKYWPEEWKKNRKTNFKTVLMTEAFWIILYLAYLWLRSHNAEIHGTERFMDMAFLKASSLTDYFPPIDPWMAGNPINYYYYGHYLFSLVSNLSGIGVNFTYTFALGIIFSSSLMLAWTFVRRFVNSKTFALLAAFWIIISGTAAFGACIIQTLGACSYVKSTRLYEPSYIINEIPSYSFTVGDLHAHLIALPFFLLVLFFLYELFNKETFGFGLIGIMAVILASLGMMNPWDFVSLAMIVFLIAVFRIFRAKKSGITWIKAWDMEKMIVVKTVFLGVFAVILMLPFLMHFEGGAGGIGFSPVYAANHNLLYNYQYPTPFWGWIGIWGGFALILALSAAILRRIFFNAQNFTALLILAGILLLAGVELFFVKDIYSLANPPYFRANTVFKFGFHTWTLLSLAAASTSAQALREYKFSRTRLKNARIYARILPVIITILVLLGLFYPIKALNEFYLSSNSAQTLDGSLFLKTLYPDDYAAVMWLNNNARQREVLIEAAGDSYTDYGRIGIFSGMMNPINWMTHEWGWRFKPQGEPPADPNAPRESGWSKVAALSGEIRGIYESNDPETTRALLRKHSAGFIYIGDLERKEYPNLMESKFYQLGSVIFSSGNAKLFKLEFE